MVALPACTTTQMGSSHCQLLYGQRLRYASVCVFLVAATCVKGLQQDHAGHGKRGGAGRRLLDDGASDARLPVLPGLEDPKDMVLPDFWAIGQAKCATSTLWSVIGRHPSVKGVSFKELSWWSGVLGEAKCDNSITQYLEVGGASWSRHHDKGIMVKEAVNCRVGSALYLKEKQAAASRPMVSCTPWVCIGIPGCLSSTCTPCSAIWSSPVHSCAVLQQYVQPLCLSPRYLF